MLKVDADSVAALLAKLAAGDLAAETAHDGIYTWTIRASGYVIEIFDDSGVPDYVERVTAPNGKTATFKQFMNARGRDPIDQLSDQQKKRLSALLGGDYVQALMDNRQKGRRRKRR